MADKGVVFGEKTADRILNATQKVESATRGIGSSTSVSSENVTYVEITEALENGFYLGVQRVFDFEAVQDTENPEPFFIEPTSGNIIQFNGGPNGDNTNFGVSEASNLFEINGMTGVPAGTIVQVFPAYGIAGGTQWVFDVKSALLLPFQLSYDSDISEATVGAFRSESWYPFEDSIRLGGQEELIQTSPESISASDGDVIFYEITISTFMATLNKDTALPADTADTRHVEVGRIKGNQAHQTLYGIIRLDLGEVRVSIDDLELGLLYDKIQAPSDTGDVANGADNLALVVYVANPAGAELVALDFDIQLLPSQTISTSDHLMLASGQNHYKATLEDIYDNIDDIFVTASSSDTTAGPLFDASVGTEKLRAGAGGKDGYDPVSTPDNDALYVYVTNEAGDEEMWIDMDIARLVNLAPNSTDVIMFAPDSTAPTHQKRTFGELAGDAIQFLNNAFALDGKRSITTDTDQAQLVNDLDDGSLSDGYCYSYDTTRGWHLIEDLLITMNGYNASFDQFIVSDSSGGSPAEWRNLSVLAGELLTYSEAFNSLDVDLTGITGYDSGKTQFLGHISGTLTWIDSSTTCT